MAQEFLEDDLFTTEPDVQNLDTIFNLDNIEPEEAIQATEEDRKQASKPKSETAPKAQPKKQKVPDPEEEPEEEVEVVDEMDEEAKSNPDKKGEESSSEELSDIAAIADGLFKSGIWSRDDEDDNELPQTDEEFLERQDYEGRKIANSYVTQIATRHGDEAKELFDAVYVKGVPVREYVTRWQESQDFKSMDLTIEENQERVVEAALKEQGIPEDKIREKIRKLKLSEDLADEAGTYHGALVRKQEQRLQKMEQDAQIAKEQEKQKHQQFISNVTTILNEKLKSQDFDGIPVNSKTAEYARNMLTKPTWKLRDGSLVTDWDMIKNALEHPSNQETLVKLALMFEPYQQGKPLKLKTDAIEKRAVSKEATKLFNLKKPGSKNETKPVPETTKQAVDLSDLF